MAPGRRPALQGSIKLQPPPFSLGFLLVPPSGRVNIRATVRNQIPICPLRSDTIRRGICTAIFESLRDLRIFYFHEICSRSPAYPLPLSLSPFLPCRPRGQTHGPTLAAAAPTWILSWLSPVLVAGTVIGAQQPALNPSFAAGSPVPALLKAYCVSCHDAEMKTGGIDLESISQEDWTFHPDAWERVVRKLRARQMPPAGKKRPDERTCAATVAALASALDRAAAKHPNPGRTETFRRLNRAEYRNSIRDLLALDIDAAALLPKDDVSHGFDNVTVGNLSPTLLDRYISAAQKISRLAVGAPHRAPGGDTIRIRPDLTQEEHVEGLPVGTRGGTVLPYTFTRDGEYEIQIRLTRDRNEEIEGLREPHELEVLLDRERVKLFTVAPPSDKNYETVDGKLKVRIHVTAGPHQLGVTFLKHPSELLETKRQPYN